MTQDALPYVEVNPDQPHDAVVVWLHGLGDSGNGFAPIVPELGLPADHRIRFIFPHAPIQPVTINGGMQMRAWYDIKSLDFNQRADVDGVQASAEAVKQLVESEIAAGIPSERILLAGFSQGGVIALHLGTRFEQSLGGILALSTYMCQPESLAAQAHDANRNTPVMFAHGQQDEVVPMFLGHAAFKVLEDNGYSVSWKDYLMQHNVCMQELKDISDWIQARLA